jgi:hypothetical protein
MNFLEISSENFFSLPETRVEPFGQGPWPCLNRASDHFGEPKVMRCEITQPFWDRDRNLLGTFYCECGFVYCRKGPDRTPESRYQFTRIKSYGEVWNATLLMMRESEGHMPNDIAVQLGTSYTLIRDHLKKLRHLQNLGENVKGPKSGHPKSRDGAALALQETYRRQWLHAIKNNPEAGRSDLRKIVKSAYNRLSAYDKEWFEANSPPRQKPRGPRPLTDWERSDAELTVKAKAKAVAMISAPGRPVRASATAIAKAIGVSETIHKRGSLLPLTIEVLSEVSETVEAYAIRRIQWAAQCFRKEKVKLVLGELQIRAAVSSKVWKKEEVRKVVDEIMRSFKSQKKHVY